MFNAINGETNKLNNESVGNFEGGKQGNTNDNKRKNATSELPQKSNLVMIPPFFKLNYLYLL